MKNGQQKTSSVRMSDQPKQSKLIYWLLLLFIILIGITIFLHPLRIFSKHFVDAGDNFLIQKKYVSASLEYEKALILDPNDEKALSHKEIAENSQTDITALLPFLKEKDAQSELDKFELANSFPKNENAALETSKQLMDEGEFQLAIIPAETAAEMAPDYDVAKTYLTVAKKKAGQLAELTPAAQNYYLQSN